MAGINAQPFVLPMSGTYDETLLGAAMRAVGIRPTQIVARVNFVKGRFAVVAKGKCITYAVDSAIEAAPQSPLRKLVALKPWSRWLFISERVEPAIADGLRGMGAEAFSVTL